MQTDTTTAPEGARTAHNAPPTHTTKQDQTAPAAFAQGTPTAFAIECRALVSVPEFDTHERANNFAAIIEHDPTAPAGLSRHFLPVARGRFYYIADDLRTGQALEIGADRRSHRNHRTTRRTFAAVEALQIGEDGRGEVILRRFETPAEAIARARQIAEGIKTTEGTTTQQGAERARQFARQFAARVEHFAAKYETHHDAHNLPETDTPDDFAARLIISAANAFDSDDARPLRGHNFAATLRRNF